MSPAASLKGWLYEDADQAAPIVLFLLVFADFQLPFWNSQWKDREKERKESTKSILLVLEMRTWLSHRVPEILVICKALIIYNLATKICVWSLLVGGTHISWKPLTPGWDRCKLLKQTSCDFQLLTLFACFLSFQHTGHLSVSDSLWVCAKVFALAAAFRKEPQKNKIPRHLFPSQQAQAIAGGMQGHKGVSIIDL